MRVPWTARRSNQSILKEISPGISFLFCGRIDSSHVADYAGLPGENEDIRVVSIPVAEAEKMLEFQLQHQSFQ